MVKLNLCRLYYYPGSIVTENRSSHPRCSLIKALLRNFAKMTRKYLCQSLFFNKVAGLSPATLLKKRLWHGCSPVSFAKCLRKPFFTDHLWTTASERTVAGLSEFSGHNYLVLINTHKCLYTNVICWHSMHNASYSEVYFFSS